MIDSKYMYLSPPRRAIAMASKNVAVKREEISLLGRILLPGFDDESQKAPAVIILHGFPGNEKYIDLAQVLRRCGFVVFNAGFAGCWGSGGLYRFSTLTDDLQANIAYLKENAEQLHVDVERIFLVAHSMGGFTALRGLADGLKVRAACLLSPCNLARRLEDEEEKFDEVFTRALPFITTQTGSIEELKQDLAGKLEHWRFSSLAQKIPADLPLLFIGGKRDAVCPPPTHMEEAVKVLQDRQANVRSLLLDDDHSFQNQRIEMIEAVCRFLADKAE